MRLKRPHSHLVPPTSLVFCMFTFLTLFGTQVSPAYAASPSFVRIIHASPYIGVADIFVDGAKLLSGVPFGAITDYASISPGPHHVQIALIGKGPGAAVLTQDLAVKSGVTYTVAAIGATPSTLSLQVFIDNNLLAPGTAKLRVYHLSPNLGPLSVNANGKTLIQGISYQQASDYIGLSAGPYTFNVNAAQVNTTLPLATTLQANMVTSIFAIGMFNGNPKAELKPAQAAGLPGLPGTGSDPNAPAASTSTQLPIPWLLGALTLLTLAGYVMRRRRAGVR
jgi:hypothetical protein